MELAALSYIRKRTVPVANTHLAWWIPALWGALAAVLLFLPLLIVGDLAALYLFLIVPCLALSGVCALLYAAIRKELLTAVMVVAFCAVSAVAFVYNVPIRTFTKWALLSGCYKHEVLASPTVNGDLKHIESDSAGFAGIDSTTFLVFDPTNSLAAAAQNGQSGKLKGIPCEVGYVRRMESHWYLVFTDLYAWGRCD
jgi:hypothetical protein